jgi:glycosyltransferase involved in cell wall biosynthesis
MRTQEVPAIAPVGDRDGRPFWSVMIPSYNSADLLAETLASVLDQDPGPEEMQIEVVDDASTDGRVDAVIRRIAGLVGGAAG